MKIRKYILSCIILLTSLYGVAQTKHTLIEQEQNKQLIIKVNNLFNEFKSEEAIKYFSDSLVKKGNIGGKSFFLAINDDILQTFPDVQTKIIKLWIDEDWVIADCLFSGTHKGISTLPHHGGLLIGKSPTNKSFQVQHIRMYKIRDGKIIERKAVRDDISMYQQLDLLPSVPVFKPAAEHK
jgi:predicted ester cyclase